MVLSQPSMHCELGGVRGVPHGTGSSLAGRQLPGLPTTLTGCRLAFGTQSLLQAWDHPKVLVTPASNLGPAVCLESLSPPLPTGTHKPGSTYVFPLPVPPALRGTWP